MTPTFDIWVLVEDEKYEETLQETKQDEESAKKQAQEATQPRNGATSSTDPNGPYEAAPSQEVFQRLGLNRL